MKSAETPASRKNGETWGTPCQASLRRIDLRSRSVPRKCEIPLIQRIRREPAEELWVEIGGLLRHHFSGQCHLAHLLHRARIHQEGNVRGLLAGGFASNGRKRFRRFPHIRQILLIANRLLGKLQHAFQQNSMQLNYVERLLARRKPGKEFCCRRLRRMQQQGTIRGYTEKCSPAATSLLQQPSRLQCLDRLIHGFHLEELSAG